MRIKSLVLKGFRSFQDELIEFQPDLTTFVGENNSGKSTVGLALTKLFTQMTIGNEQIGAEDYPYGHAGPVFIEANIQLTAEEFQKVVVSQIMPTDLTTDSLVQKWLLEQGSGFKISLARPSRTSIPNLRWGELNIFNNQISVADINQNTSGPSFHDALRKAISESSTPGQINHAFGGQYSVPGFLSPLGNFCLKQYKLIDEFRVRPQKSQRKSGAIESMNGSETANALLTLKNHADPNEKARYGEIQSSFRTLFSHYTVDAVESEPGSNIPDVQFYEEGRTEPLALNQVSSGVVETLMLVTNLIGRNRLIIFLEHPESHLHPHGLRWLKSFLLKSAEQNQIIVVTHDPFLIDPKAVLGIRRFWWIHGQGTIVCSSNTSLGTVEVAQMGTALRYLSDREVVFARAVLLVEDESLREFLIATAPTLGYDLDSHGISVIFTGGHGGHRHFHTLLDNLGIPHINLRDKSWGNNINYPTDRFFSLDAEFEEYIDGQGLAEIRKEVVKQAGNSHRRQAALLGERLEKSQVPQIFDNILKTAVDLATSRPVTR